VCALLASSGEYDEKTGRNRDITEVNRAMTRCCAKVVTVTVCMGFVFDGSVGHVSLMQHFY